MVYIMVEHLIQHIGVTSSMERNGLSHEEAGRLGAIKSTILAREQKKAREDEYYKDPKKCPVCGTVIPYDKRNQSTFCSRSCSATDNNRKFPKRKTSKEDRICPTCGKVVPRTSRNKFCCQTCANNFKHVQLVKYTDNTGEFRAQRNGEASRRFVKSYLVEKYGHKCSICGITEWQGKPAPLVVDHIDGDSTNNRIENFRLVCGNCDMQLPTYKAKNKTGRDWRRKYYTHVGPLVRETSPEVHLKCQWCGKEFTRRAANVPVNGVDKDRFYSCSRSCAAQLSSAIKNGIYTDDQLEQMHKDNIVSR